MPVNYPRPTVMIQKIQENIGEGLMVSWPVKDLPINIRPGMIFVTAAWLLLLGVLGMAPLHDLPINDKAMHFFGLGFATFLIYFIIEVPEGPARRVWYVRRAPLILTLVVSFFVGGVISEFVQGLLPWREFQFGDIVANLLGSTVFLYLAHLLANRLRRRSELSTLYQPLSDQSTYRDARGRHHAFNQSDDSPASNAIATRRSDRDRGRSDSIVWDEESDAGRDSLDDIPHAGGTTQFGIGEYEEDDRPTSKDQPVTSAQVVSKGII